MRSYFETRRLSTHETEAGLALGRVIEEVAKRLETDAPKTKAEPEVIWTHQRRLKISDPKKVETLSMTLLYMKDGTQQVTISSEIILPSTKTKQHQFTVSGSRKGVPDDFGRSALGTPFIQNPQLAEKSLTHAIRNWKLAPKPTS